MRAASALAVAAGIGFLLATACAGRQSEPTEGPDASPSVRPLQPTEFVQCQQGDRWAAVVVADLGESRFTMGEPIELTLVVLNCQAAELTLNFPSAQRYDFLATDEDGQLVWRWSADKVFAQALGEETLAQDASLVYRETWDQRDGGGVQVPAGPYRITAWITGCTAAQECNVAGQTDIEITP